jgi:hypothetical protein
MSPAFFVGKIHFDKLIQFNIKTNMKAIEALKQLGLAIVHFEEPEDVLVEMVK